MTATRATCEERIGERAGDFGMEPVLCSQVVGVRQWYDSEGALHAACALHSGSMVRRFPEADPPEPKWLHEQPEYADPITAAKSWTDAGWTESELREAFGG